MDHQDLLHAMHASTAELCNCRYVLAYIETSQGVAKGERVWQLAFGSGALSEKSTLTALRVDFHPAITHTAWCCYVSTLLLLLSTA